MVILISQIFDYRPFSSPESPRPSALFDGMVLKSTEKYFRVGRREIAFLKFVIESYDGVAVISTIDPAKGLVVLQVPPGREPEADAIIADLERDILIEPVSGPV